MTPDYEKAATKAVETLIKHNITSSPISPLPILKNTPNVLVVNFSDIGFFLGKERRHMISMFGDHNQDAVTFVDIVNDKKHYIVTYNQQLPYALIQRALARELAHIVLGHDGSLPEEIREGRRIVRSIIGYRGHSGGGRRLGGDGPGDHGHHYRARVQGR